MHYNLGPACMSNETHGAAERHFRVSLQVRPGFALGLNSPSWVLVQQGMPGAVAVEQRAINHSPKQSRLLDNLLQAREAQGKLPQAIEAQ